MTILAGVSVKVGDDHVLVTSKVSTPKIAYSRDAKALLIKFEQQTGYMTGNDPEFGRRLPEDKRGQKLKNISAKFPLPYRSPRIGLHIDEPAQRAELPDHPPAEPELRAPVNTICHGTMSHHFSQHATTSRPSTTAVSKPQF